MILRILWQTALLLALATGAGALVWKFHPEAPELYLSHETAGLREMTVAEAKARLAKGQPIVWLDARHEKEFNAGHIEGALLLNEYHWETLLEQAFPVILESPPGTPVVIYCDGQACAASRTVRDRLDQTPLGDREPLILRGGWPAWQAARP
jgi:rhodanese-related sulfurtransferase